MREALLDELELVEVEHDYMASAEDGHEHAQAAEEQRVEGAAQRPPRAQAQEHQEVGQGRHRGKHDACGPHMEGGKQGGTERVRGKAEIEGEGKKNKRERK